MLLIAAAFWPVWILRSASTPSVTANNAAASSVTGQASVAAVTAVKTSTATVGG